MFNKISIIGCGLIGSSILRAVEEKKLASKISVYDKAPKVIDYLKSQKSMAIVLVEQYFDFAFQRADNIFAMTRGEIVYEGSKAKINKNKLREAVSI